MPLLGERTVEERSGASTFPLPSMLGWATFLVALKSLQSELRVAIADLTSLFVPEVPEDCLCSTFSGLLGLKREALRRQLWCFEWLCWCSVQEFSSALIQLGAQVL